MSRRWIRTLQATDPDLLPQGTVLPDPMTIAILEAAAKRGLLEHVYRQHAAGPAHQCCSTPT